MLTFLGSRHRSCDGISRRSFLTVGALGIGGLSLADVLRLQCKAASGAAKSVIMIYLPGGPSHIDMYDMKPDAPAEIRGEFKPIQTSVPGFPICEMMPLQAKIADKFSVVHGIRSVDTHSADELMRGFWGITAPVQKRPVFGAIVSRIRGSSGPQGMPRYVSLGGDPGEPEYLGPGHRPFRPSGTSLENLTMHRSVDASRLADRKALLQTFDGLSRDLDNRAGDLAAVDDCRARALAMIASGKVRDALDVRKEPQAIRDRYDEIGREFLAARRFVEAGVSVVTLSANYYRGDWDTHGIQQAGGLSNFQHLRGKLPPYDRCVHALITDLHERGLDKDVAVVIWGEFGRAPRINEIAGRHHWPSAGTAVLVGGGLKMGQVVGDTGPRGERERRRSTPYTPQNILATLYGVLGINPETTLPDFSGRPQYLLDVREPIKELV